MKNNNENNHFLYVENQILCVKISFIIFIIFFINIILFSFRSLNHHPFDKKNTINSDKINKIIDDNFEYHNYERELITDKIKKYAGYEQKDNEPYFLNGIIRIFKPKKCLEIGVARGGSSIVILNALKDYFLYKILLLLYDYLIYDYFLFIHIKPWLFIPYHYEFSNLLYN